MKNLSQTQAGIMALNVVSDENFLEINGVRIERKEWEGKSVISSYDISRIHKRPVKRVNESFKRNINKFVESEDFFRIPADSGIRSVIATGSFKHSNNKFENLFTKRGYLKLTKTFTNNTEYKIIKKVYEFLGGNENIDIYVSNERLEISFFKLLKEALKEIDVKLIHQYYVSGYRIDFFIPEYNLAIEYDEDHHKLRTKEEKIREKEIKKETGCKFIRCSYRDSNIKNLMKILKETVLKRK